MKTQPQLLQQFTPYAEDAERLLRQCVHCGFCNSTCPTYLLQGDEREGPRGRIYLIQQVLEGQAVSDVTRQHLDHCLLCRNCETTCPSGVNYHTLYRYGREALARRSPRPAGSARVHRLLGRALQSAWLSPLLRSTTWIRPMLPRRWRGYVPAARFTPATNAPARRMVLLDGCVQQAMAPQINDSAAWLLAHTGVEVLRVSGCCGALDDHLELASAADRARRLIDQLWPLVDQGIDAIVSTASGCGVFLKEYDQLFAHDPETRARAEKIVALVQDISEALDDQQLAPPPPFPAGAPTRLALQVPCTFQHGLHLPSQKISNLLGHAGFQLTRTSDDHLCCGSAGVYSLLHAPLARQLRHNKLAALTQDQPQGIATANVGCRGHLQSGTNLPVAHWVEWLAQRAGAPISL